LEHSHTLAVVVAGGRSSRMGAALRKPFLTLEGTPVLVHTVRALAEAPSVKRIVVVVHPDDQRRAEQQSRNAPQPAEEQQGDEQHRGIHAREAAEEPRHEHHADDTRYRHRRARQRERARRQRA